MATVFLLSAINTRNGKVMGAVSPPTPALSLQPFGPLALILAGFSSYLGFWGYRSSSAFRLPTAGCAQICQETISQRKTSNGQGCQTEPYRLKPSSLVSVKVNYWKIAIGQGVKVPSPGIFNRTQAVVFIDRWDSYEKHTSRRRISTNQGFIFGSPAVQEVDKVGQHRHRFCLKPQCMKETQ